MTMDKAQLDTASQPAFQEFFDQYVETALWASMGDDDEPLDRNHDADDIHPDTLADMRADCLAFVEEAGGLIADDMGQAGHDFWLTREGHGAGFWDGDWPEEAGRTLTNLSKRFGEYGLYVGGDGTIHH